eukprot:286047-Hanusia_phi.AAC.1
MLLAGAGECCHRCCWPSDAAPPLWAPPLPLLLLFLLLPAAAVLAQPQCRGTAAIHQDSGLARDRVPGRRTRDTAWQCHDGNVATPGRVQAACYYGALPHCGTNGGGHRVVTRGRSDRTVRSLTEDSRPGASGTESCNLAKH